MEPQTHSLVSLLHDAAIVEDEDTLANLLREDQRCHLRITRLHNAALAGDVTCLLDVLQEDPLILDRSMIEKSSRFIQSPLHIAASVGHLEFATEILQRKPELAEELDQSKCFSPLHLASIKGHLEIVKALLVVNPTGCFARDRIGRNSIHIAAIYDQLHVLGELLRVMPRAAKERTNSGETILHLCVKYSRLEALKLVMHVLDDGELLNSKDGDGNTVLHLAVDTKQPQLVKFLVEHKMMEKNAINANGSTALDVFNRSRKKDAKSKEIWLSLKRAKALKAKDSQNLWLENQRSALMVVASLIATMAFQVGINPPGGAWQDNEGHTAGISILADTQSGKYDLIISYSIVGLISSLSVILLLISGLPCKRPFVVILMITMWVAISTTMFTYLQSIFTLSTSFSIKNTVNELSNSKVHIVGLAIYSSYAWLSLLLLLFLSHAIRFLVKPTMKILRLGMKFYHKETNFRPM